MNTGIFGEGFPYSNFHDLNTDWIIKIAKDFLDQYTHIQEIIENGEQSILDKTSTGLEQLQDKTDTGLEQLQDKADELETLLQEWYDTHSTDIADALADALQDLNDWYTIHQNYLDQTLAQNIQAFTTTAQAKAAETLESIPEDYTELSEEISNVDPSIVNNRFFMDSIQQTSTSSGVWAYDRDSATVSVTNASGFTFLNFYTYDNTPPEWFIPGKKVLIGINNLDASPNTIFVDVYWKDSNDTQTHLDAITDYLVWTIPSTATALAIRLTTYSTFTGTQRVQPFIMTLPETIFNGAWDYIYYKHQGIPTALNPDFNTYTKSGYYGLQSGITYTHAPTDIGFISGGILEVFDMFKNGAFIIQILYSANTNELNLIHIRRKNNANQWTDWSLNGDLVLYTSDTSFTSCNDVNRNCVIVVSTNEQSVPDLANFPYQSPGWLFTKVAKNGNSILQYVFPWNDTNMPMYRNYRFGTWYPWHTFNNYGNTYNIENTFNEYSNTYNVTATPTITSDSNNYLASTGDSTDRTSDIITMLTQTGTCHLGVGVFYVHNLEMPEGTSIIGSGTATKVILSGTSAGYAIKMMSECSVQDLSISGVASGTINLTDIFDSNLDPSYAIRHGILWQWEFTRQQAGEQVTGHTPTRGLVSNVRINGFTGGAITCYDTGEPTNSGIECSNVYIWNCNVGINIEYYSEFNKFTNVTSTHGYYGAVNNGGSNCFTNCNFCRNVIGMLFDASINGAPNNTHASASDCIIGHIGDPMNTGIGIKIVGCKNGYNFTGIQLFYASIYIEDSSGIVFDNCNFGKDYFNDHRYDKITILGGGSILFANSMFENDPVINVTSNTKTHFINCYNRSSGNAITP